MKPVEAHFLLLHVKRWGWFRLVLGYEKASSSALAYVNALNKAATIMKSDGIETRMTLFNRTTGYVSGIRTNRSTSAFLKLCCFSCPEHVFLANMTIWPLFAWHVSCKVFIGKQTVTRVFLWHANIYTITVDIIHLKSASEHSHNHILMPFIFLNTSVVTFFLVSLRNHWSRQIGDRN